MNADPNQTELNPDRGRIDRERDEERQTRQLLRDLVRNAVPPVPRKLNRVGELFGLCLDVARENGWPLRHRKERLTLLRLVILQLLAPDLYRFGRHNPAFLSKLESWCAKYSKQANLVSIQDAIRDSITKNEAALSDPDKAQTATNDLYTARRLDQPLLDLLRTAQQHRSRFDPLKLLDSENPCDDGIHRYFNLERSAVTLRPITGTMAASMDEFKASFTGDVALAKAVHPEDLRTPGAPSDPDGFFNQLFSTDEIAWRNAIEQEAERLNEHVLDDASFRALLDRVRRAPQVVSVRWLELLNPYLSADQLIALYREGKLLQRLNDVIQGAPTK